MKAVLTGGGAKHWGNKENDYCTTDSVGDTAAGLEGSYFLNQKLNYYCYYYDSYARCYYYRCYGGSCTKTRTNDVYAAVTATVSHYICFCQIQTTVIKIDVSGQSELINATSSLSSHTHYIYEDRHYRWSPANEKSNIEPTGHRSEQYFLTQFGLDDSDVK